MPLPILYLCSQQEVIDRFGGAVALTQCLDPHQTGAYDPALLDSARLDGSSDVMAAGGNRFKLWQVVTPLLDDVPPWIRKLAALRAMVYCWDRGTAGKARPEFVQRVWDQTEKDLDNLRAGEIGTGLGEPPSRTSIRPRPIDNSDGGRRATYGVWRRSGWR